MAVNDTEIKFYDKNEPYYDFSNFWGSHMDKKFKLSIDERDWPSSEHYYQAQKYAHKLQLGDKHCRAYFELIAAAPTPNKCFILATQRKRSGFGANWKYSASNPKRLNEIVDEYAGKVSLRKDWHHVKQQVMRKALRFKFTQNAHLKSVLLATGDATLIEHTKRDSYWGDGGDGTGQNMLGFLLMAVRKELAGEEAESGRKKRKRSKEEAEEQVELDVPPKKRRKLEEQDVDESKPPTDSCWDDMKARKALLDAQRERIWG